MPITQSAKKAHRKSLKRAERNLDYKKRVKDLIKEIRSLISQNKIKEAKKFLPQLYKTLDKVAKAGYIRKGNADRKKSRITKLIAKSER
jgi:small subunit ribosomal protein S20